MSYSIDKISTMFDTYNLQLIDDISDMTYMRKLNGNVSLCNNTQQFNYKFDSDYVALNYKLYDKNNKIIFEVKTTSNKEMVIYDSINNITKSIKSSAMNDICNVGLLYSESEKILYICINYVCLGYQSYVYKLKINSYIP